MFIDEIYEDELINKAGKLTSAHVRVCKEKLEPNTATPKEDVQRIENGYQLFRKRHPEFPEDSFRRYCYVKWSRANQNPLDAQTNFYLLGWGIKPEYEMIGR